MANTIEHSPFEKYWLYLYVAEMEFVYWSYLTIYSLEAATSKHLFVGNIIVYFGMSKVVVVMSSLY